MKSPRTALTFGLISWLLFLLGGAWAVYWIQWAIQDAQDWEPLAAFVFAIAGMGASAPIGVVAAAIGLAKADRRSLKVVAVAALVVNGVVTLCVTPFFLRWGLSILDF